MQGSERKELHAALTWIQRGMQPTAIGKIRGSLVQLHLHDTALVETKISRRHTVAAVAGAQAAMRGFSPPVSGETYETAFVWAFRMHTFPCWFVRRSCGPLPTWDEFFEKCEDVRPSDSSDVSLPLSKLFGPHEEY